MIYFTSDHHFFHNNVIRYCDRPYETVEQMNIDLVQKWNSVVGHEDIVYYLGDFSLAFRPVEIFSRQLNGHKKLIPGNHDWCHPAHKKGRREMSKWIAKYEENGWEVLPIFSELDLPGVARVNLCHMPYVGDNTDERYSQFRLTDDDRILLCGHVHEKWKTKRRMINVGVDVWGMTPVSETQLAEVIREL